MGEPIARRMLEAGARLQVWNRTPEKCAPLRRQGAVAADSVEHLMSACDVIFLMLRDAEAIDSTLGRESRRFSAQVRAKTLINLGTCAPAYSLALAIQVQAAGGRYVEAPVSGSRVQAEQGRLVAMLAGETSAVDEAIALLAPALSRSFRCGKAPEAMRLKLAVNHFLIVMVAGLTEAVNAARSTGLDLSLLRELIDAGPMASEVSRIKLDKLVRADFTPQAAIGDVRTIAELVTAQARQARASSPLMDSCLGLYQLAERAGRSGLDMIAIGESAA